MPHRIVLVLCLAAAGSASAQCTRDTDCKGSRICESGQCVEAPVAQDAPLVAAPLRLEPGQAVRLADLTADLRSLREELDNATLVGPIIKLVGSGGAFIGALLLFNLASNAQPSDLRSNNITFGAAFTGVGIGLAIWGGIQLGKRLRARAELPGKIALAEAAIADLQR